MGISGLLPVLKSCTTHVHIAKYSGQRVAIDGYSWLHKGAYSCSRELCEGTPTDKYISFCMERVRLLRSCSVTPVLVFDGGHLPMKALEENSRHKSRREALDRAISHIQAGNNAAANECFQKAVDISPAVAKRFIEVLKREGVEFIVAPYEADAQLAFLALSGDVAAVITEDSDLLAYGCPKVLFKMDRSGDCQEIAIADLGLNRDLNFVGFTPDMFLQTCIMAGCDFVKALPGIGIKKAHGHLRRLRSFLRVAKSLRFTCSVPRSYEEDVQRAIWTFRHQRVFCRQSQRLVHLNPLPEIGLAAAAALPSALQSGDEELRFLGPPIPDDVACAIASGDLDPITWKPFPNSATMATPAPAGRPLQQQLNQQQPAKRLKRPSQGRKVPASGANSPGIAAYFTPKGRVSSGASQPFRPPFGRNCGSGGLQESVAERPAEVAATHAHGCQSQPESRTSGDMSRNGTPTGAVRKKAGTLAERFTCTAGLRGPFGAFPAQADDQLNVELPLLPLSERLSKKYREPSAAAATLEGNSHKKRKGLQTHIHSAEGAAHQAEERPPLQEVRLPKMWGRLTDDSAIQPPQDQGSGSSEAAGRAAVFPTAAMKKTDAAADSDCRSDAKENGTNEKRVEGEGNDGGDSICNGDGCNEPKRLLTDTFASLSHVRQYALEASKALDRLRRKSPMKKRSVKECGARVAPGATAAVHSAAQHGCSRRLHQPPQKRVAAELQPSIRSWTGDGGCNGLPRSTMNPVRAASPEDPFSPPAGFAFADVAFEPLQRSTPRPHQHRRESFLPEPSEEQLMFPHLRHRQQSEGGFCRTPGEFAATLGADDRDTTSACFSPEDGTFGSRSGAARCHLDAGDRAGPWKSEAAAASDSDITDPLDSDTSRHVIPVSPRPLRFPESSSGQLNSELGISVQTTEDDLFEAAEGNAFAASLSQAVHPSPPAAVSCESPTSSPSQQPRPRSTERGHCVFVEQLPAANSEYRSSRDCNNATEHTRRRNRERDFDSRMMCYSKEAALHHGDSLRKRSPQRRTHDEERQRRLASAAATDAQTDHLKLNLEDRGQADCSGGKQCASDAFVASLLQEQRHSEPFPGTPLGARFLPETQGEWGLCGPATRLGPSSGFSVPESPCLDEEPGSGRRLDNTPLRFLDFDVARDPTAADDCHNIEISRDGDSSQPGASFAASLDAGNASRDVSAIQTLLSGSPKEGPWQDGLSASQDDPLMQCIPESEERGDAWLLPAAPLQPIKPQRSGKLPDFSQFAFRGTTHLAA